MIPTIAQLEMGKAIRELVEKYNLAYLAAEERTGKTLGTILACEDLEEEDIIVFTKKDAIEGWTDTLAKFKHAKNYTVTNYHQIANTTKTRGALVVLDEAHAYLSGYPKPSAMWKKFKQFIGYSRVIFISATPNAQGYQLLYHQLTLSAFSPWKSFKNFYLWFRVYGDPYYTIVHGREVQQYDKTLPKAKESVQHLFYSKTRKELGFEQEPEDKLHYITLDQTTKDVYNDLMTDKVVLLRVGKVVCESKSSLRMQLHMLEGGSLKLQDKYYILSNTEKIDYILKHFGDTEDLVIMHNYTSEAEKLKQHFKKAKILQATKYAEGVDLSMYEHLIIYSMNFSTAKFSQRRARQANMNRKNPIIVHYLLVKKAISEQCYKTVALNKRNFVDSTFKQEKI